MVGLGAFEIILGASYLAQERLRGQGLFLIALGVLLVGAGFLIRRGEAKRARRAAEPKPTRAATRRAPVKTVRRAKGPRAGAGHRLAGPARTKVVDEQPKTLTERLFGGKEDEKPPRQ